MHFGATLRLLRVDAGLTLRELAERVGVSNAYLSRVENGHDAPPTPDRLVAIGRLLGLEPTTLIELADRIGPFTSDYVERSEATRELFLEIARRQLGPIQIARIRAFIEREFPARSGPAKMTRALEATLDPEHVVMGLSCGDIEDVIDVAATKLASATGRSARELGEAIAARERVCPSALGGRLAVPHALLEPVEPRAVVVTLRRGLELDAPDGLAVKMFIVHVHCGGKRHAGMLAEMARLAEPDIVSAACAARAPASLVAGLLAHTSRC
jgi:PTS system nitrogen regulatory IIA component